MTETSQPHTYKWWKTHPAELRIKESKSLLHGFKSGEHDPEGLTINPYVGCAHRCVYCVTPDTHIITSEGLKFAYEISERDSVLTHVGRFQPVTNVVRHSYAGTIFRLRPHLVNVPIGVTPDQPILVSEDGAYRWRPARDLSRGEKLVFAIPNLEVSTPRLPFTTDRWHHFTIKVTPPVARFLGYWLAEGTVNSSSAIIGFGHHETAWVDDAASIVENDMKELAGRRKATSIQFVTLYDKSLAGHLHEFFYHNGFKQLPTEYLSLPNEAGSQLLAGYFRGDGSATSARKCYAATNSPYLAGQVLVLLLRLGYTPGVRRTKVAGKQAVIRGKVVTTRHDRYDVSISGAHLNRFLELVGWPPKPRTVTYSRLKVRGNFLEIPLRKLETIEYSGDVYDFEVANDRSFCAPYVALHNCYASYEWSPDFYDIMYAKANAADVLERELGSWKLGEIKPVFIASATDCYQPVEGFLRLTMKCVEVLQRHRVPYYIFTKSSSIVRDLDLHAAFPDKCFIVWSVTTIDEKTKQMIEPYASSAKGMLEALKRFSERGVHTGINIDPVIPGLTDDEEQIDRLIAAAAENGAEFASGAVLRLRGDIWKRLRDLLIAKDNTRAIAEIRKQYFLSPRTSRGYFLATREYCQNIRALLEGSIKRHGLTYGLPINDCQISELGQCYSGFALYNQKLWQQTTLSRTEDRF